MLKMEKLTNSANSDATSETFFLPPKVYGRAKANLYLSIDKIHWRTSKVYNDVRIVVKWWGDKSGNAIEGIKTVESRRKSITNQNSLRIVQYQVRTNDKLFQAYLANCEAIVFSVYSTKTQDLVGTAKCEIPMKFLNIKEGREVEFKKTIKILSSRQFNLGDIDITVRYTPLEMTHKTSTVSSVLSAPEKDPSVDAKNKRNRSKSKDKPSVNKENIEIVGVKKAISARDPIPSKPALTRVKKVPSKSLLSSVTSDLGNPLINYLSGAKMSQAQQRKTLDELMFESPARDVAESLRSFSSDNSSVTENLLLSLSKVEFSATGQMTIQKFINEIGHGKFILKCVATSKNFTKSDQDAKWISPVFESTPTSEYP